MATATHPARTAAYGAAEESARQTVWTRLGSAMGYTNTEAKRAEIRAAAEQMAWRAPAELVDVLDTPPARQVIAALFYGRAWALDRAAVVDLPTDEAGRARRLIGLAAVTGQRYMLLHTDHEVIDLVHDHPAAEQTATGVAR